MASNLIIVEFKEEVDFFLRHHPQLFTEETRVLSLLPQASVALKDGNISCHNTLDYFPKESHEQCLMVEDRVTQRIKKVIAIEDANGIKETYVNAFTYFLRLNMGYSLFILEVISNFLKEHQGIQRIYACRYRKNDHGSYLLSAQERILGELVRLFEGQRAVTLYELPGQANIFKNRLQKLAKSFLSVIYSLAERFLHDRNKPAVIFYGLKYNFDQLAHQFKGCQCFNIALNRQEFFKMKERKKGFDIYHSHLNDIRPTFDKGFERGLQLSAQAVFDLHQKEKLFFYKGIDFSSMMTRKIKRGILPNFRVLNRRIASLKRFLKRVRARVAISAMSRELSYALGELCGGMDVPSVLISHGSHVPPKNEYDRMEWLDHGKGLIDTDYRYHLLQSPWAREYAKVMGKRDGYVEVLPLIYATVDRSRKQERQLAMYPGSLGKKIIVHASTPKPRAATRFYVYETMDEYIENMKDLIEATRDMPEVFLVIRMRPSVDLSLAQLQRLAPKGEHYVVATEGAFRDYLEIADLLVSFSSTTIEEALWNKIPVLQYDRSGRYVHLEGMRANERGFQGKDSVYTIGSRRLLKGGLQWIVFNHLEDGLSEEAFARHLFKKGEASRIEDFINHLVKGQVA